MTIFRGVGGGGNATTDSEINVLTQLANQAEDFAEQAGLEADAAATSAAAASVSAASSASSAAAALASETEAALSESAAAISASNALASENASAISAATATTGASTATTQAGLSAASAAASNSSALASAASASTATTQAGIATTGAGTATTQAGIATTAAAAASGSASTASTQATNAATSASNAAVSYDSFDDRYLGSKTSDPSLDNDGNALLTGALYWNTAGTVMKVYTGTAWITFNPVNNPVDQSDIGTAPNEIPLNQYLGDLAYQDASSIAGDVGIGGAVTATSGVINANTTTDALRITQTGTGNALLVEDSTNPDSTPFVIDANGRVINGSTTSVSADDAGGADRTAWAYQANSTSVSGAGYLATYWAANTSGAGGLSIGKSRGADVNTRAVVQSGDELGQIGFVGDDGTNFISAAGIFGEVDGTPGTNDMPGRLVFSTTADGASSPTERMRITSAGNVGIGTSSPTRLLDVTTTGATNSIIISQNTTASSGGAQIRAGNPQNTIIMGTDTNAGGLTGTANASFLSTTSTTPIVFLPNEIERMRITSAGQLKTMVTGGTAVMDAYACRAWVNFNGTGTVAIRASGNVSSITDNGTGYFTANMITALPDADYVVNYTTTRTASGHTGADLTTARPDSTTAFTLTSYNTGPVMVDPLFGQATVIR